MESPSPWDFLESLWSDVDTERMVCCHCHGEIDEESGLARTFTLSSLRQSSDTSAVQQIEFPLANDIMLMYYRHMICLPRSTQYVAISHVWEPHVAELQRNRTATTEVAFRVVHAIQEEPVNICRSLAHELPGEFEVWHDYISVPQWMARLKNQIIKSIPSLFKNALMTIAYLSDVDVGHFKAMRERKTMEARCRAISILCSASWFSRVWTTMELTQSSDIRAMAKGYKLVEHGSEPFFSEMSSRWDEEVKRDGWARNLENLVGMNNGSLVPWQLGGVGLLRRQRLNGQRTGFAEAYQGLSRRCVTQPQDFFHALQGMLGTYASETSLGDPQKMITEIAKTRLSEGDFSPLFIKPASAQTNIRNMEHGYLDLKTFGLGREVQPPLRKWISFDEVSGHPKVQVQDIGVVQFIRRYGWGVLGQKEALAELCRITLDVTGLDVESFATTICVRLYGQDILRVKERLAEGDRTKQLRHLLSKLCNSKRHEYDHDVSSIADLLGLSNLSLGGSSFNCWNMSPMSFLQHHGGTIHHAASGAIVGVRCSNCQNVSLLRIALYRPASIVLGLQVYRIPGLKYFFSHLGGAGFLLKERQVVGRFVWGVPTCVCSKWTEVEIALDDLPLPEYILSGMGISG